MAAIQAGYLRQLFLDLLPLRQGVNLRRPSILAGDVKLRSVTLVHQALEFRRQLEPPFLVHASWVIATKHPVPFSSLPFICARIRGLGFKSSAESIITLLKIVSLFPLWTTFVHILAEGRSLSKGKFQQILQKEEVSRAGWKKYNLEYRNQIHLQLIVLASLVQVPTDALAKGQNSG